MLFKCLGSVRLQLALGLHHRHATILCVQNCLKAPVIHWSGKMGFVRGWNEPRHVKTIVLLSLNMSRTVMSPFESVFFLVTTDQASSYINYRALHALHCVLASTCISSEAAKESDHEGWCVSAGPSPCPRASKSEHHVRASKLGDLNILKEVGSRRESVVLVNCSGCRGMLTLPDASLT